MLQIPKLNFVFFCQSYFFFILSYFFVHDFVKPFSGQGFFFHRNKKNVLNLFFLVFPKNIVIKLFYRCHFAGSPAPIFLYLYKNRFIYFRSNFFKKNFWQRYLFGNAGKN